MSLPVTCHHCHLSFKVKDHYLGKRGACPFCGGSLVITREASPESSPPVARAVFESPLQPNTTLSLMTHIPLVACPQCGKNNLLGCRSCFFCTATLPVAPASPTPELTSTDERTVD